MQKLTDADIAAIRAAVANPIMVYRTEDMDSPTPHVMLPAEQVDALLDDLESAYKTINEQDAEIARLRNRLEELNAESD